MESGLLFRSILAALSIVEEGEGTAHAGRIQTRYCLIQDVHVVVAGDL